MKTRLDPSLNSAGLELSSSPPPILTENLLPTWPLRVLLLLALSARLLTLPWFVETGDGLLFVRGVLHYSTFNLSPHWPGYPVYIWLGQLLVWPTRNPLTALHLLSVVSTCVTLWPIAGLAAAWRQASGATVEATRRSGFLAALLWCCVPLSWLAGSEIFSDPLGLLLGLLGLWLSWLVLKTSGLDAAKWAGLVGLTAGLLLGTRLAYIVLLLPPAYTLWRTRRSRVFFRGRQLSLAWLVILAFSLTVGVWLSWQLVVEGSQFIEAARRTLQGHYTEWGGSLTTDPDWAGRPLKLSQNTLVYGLGGWWPGTPLLRLPALTGFLALVVWGGRRLGAGGRSNPAWKLALLWLVPYLVWTLVNLDLNQPRYCFPIIALACIVGGVGLPERRSLQALALPGMAIALLTVSVPLALEHRQAAPVGQLLADYSRANLNPAQDTLVLTSDLLPMAFLPTYLSQLAPDVPLALADVPTLEDRAAALYTGGRQVYTAGLPASLGPHWTPLVRLEQGRFMNSTIAVPETIQIWLYRYTPAQAAL